jgi:hypothetical protein
VYFVAFHGRLPDAPDAQKFAAMTEEQQCDAVLPRTTDCAGELMAASLLSIADDPAMKDLAHDLNKTPASDSENRAIARTQCVADRGFATAALACWATEGCEAFSTCVYAKITADRKR